MSDLPPDMDGEPDPGYLLTAYADGQLHADGMRMVEERLRADPQLRARLDEIRLLQGWLRSGLAHQPAPVRLDPLVAGRLLAQAARPLPAALRARPPRRWLVAAAVFLVVIGLPFMTVLAILGLPLVKLTETLGRSERDERPPMSIAPIDGYRRLPDAMASTRSYGMPAAAAPASQPSVMAAADGRSKPAALNAPAEPTGATGAFSQLGKEERPSASGHPPGVRDPARFPRTYNEIADAVAPRATATATAAPPPPPVQAPPRPAEVEGRRAKSKVGEPVYDVVEEDHPAPSSSLARGEKREEMKSEVLDLRAAGITGVSNGIVTFQAPHAPSTPLAPRAEPATPLSENVAHGTLPALEPVGGSAASGLSSPPPVALRQPRTIPTGTGTSADQHGDLNVAESDAVATGSNGAANAPIAEDQHDSSRVAERRRLGLEQDDPPQTEAERAMLMRQQEKFGAHKLVTELDGAPGAGPSPQQQIEGPVGVTPRGGIYYRPLANAEQASAPDGGQEVAGRIQRGNSTNVERQRDQEDEKTPIAGIEQRRQAGQDRPAQDQANAAQQQQQRYDVRDLESLVAGFPGPDLSIPEPGIANGRALKQTQGMSDQEFAEIITTVVAPERWKEPGVGLTVYNGALLVRGDADLQRQVDALLTTLRQQVGQRGADGATPPAQAQQAQQAQQQQAQQAPLNAKATHDTATGDAAADRDHAVVMAMRPASQGAQDLVMLYHQDNDALAPGSEFRIERDGRELVTVRVEKVMAGMLACRILAETWNGDARQLQAGDHALRQVRPAAERLGGSAIPADPRTLAVALAERVALAGSGDLASLLRSAGGAHFALSASPLLAEQLDQNASVRVDGTRAQALLQLVRGAGLQARLSGGALAIDRVRGALDPTDLQGLERERFRAAFGTVPMISTREDAQSTFAFSADTATYALACAQLRAGREVDPQQVQPEHFINAMPMDYPVAHGDEAFALYAEAAPSPFAAPAQGGTAPDAPGDAQRAPWSARTALVAIGAVARPAGPEERRPLHLTLAVDCSGSMAQEGGLARIQLVLDGLIGHLTADDRLALVAFGDQARVVLPATPGNAHARLQAAVRELSTGGATNVGEGLSLAYQLATESLDSGVESRVVLCTDGGTLAGEGAPAVAARIAAYRQRGITLLVLGCGSTAYQAGALEQLASQGGGQHVYLASDAEARAAVAGRLLPERLAVLGRDAKVQVTWNPERVSHYRLIGYEGRRLAHRDFRNDAVAAGQLSGDAQVTALYEVLLVEGASGPLGSAAVRYYDTRKQSQRELSCALPGSVLSAQPSPRLRLLACAGEFAEWLQRGWWSNVHAASSGRILAELQRCPQPMARELEVWVLRAQLLQESAGGAGSQAPGGGR